MIGIQITDEEDEIEWSLSLQNLYNKLNFFV
jgi:hypothetical protein